MVETWSTAVDGMSLAARCRCLHRAEARGPGAAASLPALLWANPWLVRLLAPRGQADLDPAGALRGVPGDAGAAAMVRGAMALGRGGRDRSRAGDERQRQRRGQDRDCRGQAGLDGAGLVPEVLPSGRGGGGDASPVGAGGEVGLVGLGLRGGAKSALWAGSGGRGDAVAALARAREGMAVGQPDHPRAAVGDQHNRPLAAPSPWAWMDAKSITEVADGP